MQLKASLIVTQKRTFVAIKLAAFAERREEAGIIIRRENIRKVSSE